MYGNPPSPQVVDSKYAADDIPPKVVEYKNLPYRITVGVQDGSCFGNEAIGVRWIKVGG